MYFRQEQNVQELYDFFVAGCDNCKFDSFLFTRTKRNINEMRFRQIGILYWNSYWRDYY